MPTEEWLSDQKQNSQCINARNKKRTTNSIFLTPVSYTHLDVYKRQVIQYEGGGAFHEKKDKNKKVNLGGKRRQENLRRIAEKNARSKPF